MMMEKEMMEAEMDNLISIEAYKEFEENLIKDWYDFKFGDLPNDEED